MDAMDLATAYLARIASDAPRCAPRASTALSEALTTRRLRPHAAPPPSPTGGNAGLVMWACGRANCSARICAECVPDYAGTEHATRCVACRFPSSGADDDAARGAPVGQQGAAWLEFVV